MPLSKLHEPGVGALVGVRVGVVLSSLQHMTPPAFSIEMYEQPSRLPAAAV